MFLNGFSLYVLSMHLHLHLLIKWFKRVRAMRAARESLLANQCTRSWYTSCILPLSLSLSLSLHGLGKNWNIKNPRCLQSWIFQGCRQQKLYSKFSEQLMVADVGFHRRLSMFIKASKIQTSIATKKCHLTRTEGKNARDQTLVVVWGASTASGKSG